MSEQPSQETDSQPSDDSRQLADSQSSSLPPSPSHSRPNPALPREFDEANRPREYGGRKGPDPVRYGDWEKNGRCIDF